MEPATKQQCFEGTTEECWRHYIVNSQVTDGSSKDRQIVCTATGTTTQTVQRWTKQNGMFPVGPRFLKMGFFLERTGYVVRELCCLDPSARQLAELVADNKVSVQEACDALGYKPGKNAHGSLWRLLLGKSGLLPTKKIRLQQFMQQHTSLSARARQDRLRPITVVPEGDEVQQLAHLIKLAAPLAERVVSDSFEDEDREHLRALAGEDLFFSFSNHINGLCGEQARCRNKSQLTNPIIRKGETR